jgi:hypothetical protein
MNDQAQEFVYKTPTALDNLVTIFSAKSAAAALASFVSHQKQFQLHRQHLQPK